MSSSPTSPTQALCLLALVVTVTIGAASAAGAAKPLPGSCLVAASALCANADTNAMRCLTKLAIAGDARVPTACAETIMSGMTMHVQQKPSGRTQQLSRLLNEGGTCQNTCPGDYVGGTANNHNRCNDVLTGCSGCPQGTHTVTQPMPQGMVFVQNTNVPNPNGVACSNICCVGYNGGPACCYSNTGPNGQGVYCVATSNGNCNLP